MGTYTSQFGRPKAVSSNGRVSTSRSFAQCTYSPRRTGRPRSGRFSVAKIWSVWRERLADLRALGAHLLLGELLERRADALTRRLLALDQILRVLVVDAGVAPAAVAIARAKAPRWCR